MTGSVRRRLVVVVVLACGLLVDAQDLAVESRRETWQRVPELMAAGVVRESSVVADVGAGDGFLTVRLARAVGTRGRVHASDIDPESTARLRRRVEAEGYRNVEVVQGDSADPRLPDGRFDAVFIVSAYHEMPAAILGPIRRAMTSGGRLVISEPMPASPDMPRVEQQEKHVIDPRIVIDDLRTAGFSILRRDDAFTKNLGGTTFGLIVATVKP